MNATEVVINEDSNDMDFRVETNGDANCLFVEGSTNRVGVGTGTPSNTLEITGSGTPININSTNDEVKKIQFENSGVVQGFYGCSSGTPMRILNASSTELMRIDSSGNVFFNKTAANIGTLGVQIEDDGTFGATTGAGQVAIFNRNTDDGVIVTLRQANNTEGTISVSGSTVAYNTFTGSHWSRLVDNSKPTILRGTVMESLDAMVNWYNLEFDDNDGNLQKIPHVLTDSQSVGDVVTYSWNTGKVDTTTLNAIMQNVSATIVKETDIKHVHTKISATDEAKNVYGVFFDWDDNDGDEGYNDMLIAAVGTYVVRIKSGQTVAKGDLLQSNGDGTAKVLAGSTSITADVLSTVFAKVLSNTKIETYDDGSFIVPCAFTNC